MAIVRQSETLTPRRMGQGLSEMTGLLWLLAGLSETFRSDNDQIPDAHSLIEKLNILVEQAYTSVRCPASDAARLIRPVNVNSNSKPRHNSN